MSIAENYALTPELVRRTRSIPLGSVSKTLPRAPPATLSRLLAGAAPLFQGLEMFENLRCSGHLAGEDGISQVVEQLQANRRRVCYPPFEGCPIASTRDDRATASSSLIGNAMNAPMRFFR
jgi:hypothetical protein